MSVILLNPHFPPSHGDRVSATLTKSLDACPMPLQSIDVKVLSPASQAHSRNMGGLAFSHRV